MWLPVDLPIASVVRSSGPEGLGAMDFWVLRGEKMAPGSKVNQNLMMNPGMILNHIIHIIHIIHVV